MINTSSEREYFIYIIFCFPKRKVVLNLIFRKTTNYMKYSYYILASLRCLLGLLNKWRLLVFFPP